MVAEWLTRGRGVARPAGKLANGDDLSINELILAYLRHAEIYDTKHGVPTSEVANIKLALRPLRKLYGKTPAGCFGPLALKTVRGSLIDLGLCRNEINKRVRHVVRLFRWASENELVPPATHHGLKAVAGLRRGRCEARESEPIRPVLEAFVDAIAKHVARQVWARVQLQRLTGMRPGEVCIMRMCDLDTSGKVWCYRSSRHKTEHHGRERVIYLGPRARDVLQSWLRTEIKAYLFSPREAVAETMATRRSRRKSKVQPSQQDRRIASPQRSPGDHYTTATYGRAIRRACIKAGVPHWHPHQLRHNAATWLRKEFGLETARVVLGHATADVTETYAEADRDRAAEAIGRVG